ncbi:hypothetical protein [Mycoplasmopsis cynos]|uniref:Uncharacterized protein n=2 Tax=Mycoplasmopsis cynos TaxID=171284 RepID=A0A449AHZ8_9BACT|nr:hypothetical protein [Mycoplasmopsis cynos]MCU9934958.1 hypothetical protein [Mycoplasmopsis cynos]TQC54980.1 hypothetical protein E1I74_00545 [Mycoplasmopsis cynos]UWV80827.1 hypothetical protein NW069_01480 [Mycoplasmopsis cynos]UWV81925.1 hypothetical protein NW065_02290 [Mycoplasmopsis cynos]UWV86017.1 hypothetical protein NW063_04170 [Mycoplasmopsis cynos]
MSSITGFIKKIRNEQWIYISLWALWSVLLIVIILLSTLYKKDTVINYNPDIVAGIALIWFIVFLSAIISTVIVQIYLKKKEMRSIKGQGGNK